jgi:hypothetical protein
MHVYINLVQILAVMSGRYRLDLEEPNLGEVEGKKIMKTS